MSFSITLGEPSENRIFIDFLKTKIEGGDAMVLYASPCGMTHYEEINLNLKEDELYEND